MKSKRMSEEETTYYSAEVACRGVHGTGNDRFGITFGTEDIEKFLAHIAYLEDELARKNEALQVFADLDNWRHFRPKDEYGRPEGFSVDEFEGDTGNDDPWVYAEKALTGDSLGSATLEAAEDGWARWHFATKRHYYRGGLSLCGRWSDQGSLPEAVPDISPDNCKACQRKLMAERKAGE